MESDLNYLYNKVANFKSSLNLNKLPEVNREYIYKQVIEYSQILFLINEVNRNGY